MKRCLYCNKEIVRLSNQRLYDYEQKKFCNRSCSTKYNNKLHPKRKYEGKHCTCGKRIQPHDSRCHHCKVRFTNERYGNRKITDCISKGNARTKFAHIRKHAQRVLELNNVEKKCILCGFEYPDVCHINPLSNYKEDSLVQDFNNLNNLIYLCPNHHYLFDKGLLTINTEMIFFTRELEEKLKDPEFAKMYYEERAKFEADVIAAREAEKLVKKAYMQMLNRAGMISFYAYVEFDDNTLITSETFTIPQEDAIISFDTFMRVVKDLEKSLTEATKGQILKQTKKESHMGMVETPAVVEKVEEVTTAEIAVETTTTEAPAAEAEKE